MRWRCALILVFLAIPVSAERPRRVPSEVLVGFKDRAPSPESLRVQEMQAVFDTASSSLRRVYRLTLSPDADVDAAIAALRQDPRVEFAEPNSLLYTHALPDDDFAHDQWGLSRTGWTQVWERQAELWSDPKRIGGGGVTVAVIDTGVDYRHPDIAANIWRDAKGRPGRDFVDIFVPAYVRQGYELVPGEDYRGRDFDPSDRNGHGTHVAGTIGAVAGNGIGVAGVAWKARVMPLRVGFKIKTPGGEEAGLLELDDIVAALVYAVDNGADVINMSFGAPGDEPRILRLALKHAHDNGVVLVASAGNEGSDASGFYPASDPDVICVGASVGSDLRAFFSNWGGRIDLAAPGNDVLSLWPGGYYLRSTGTSMAAPHVAGAAALLLSREPGLGPEGVLARLVSGAVPTGEMRLREGHAYPFGAGRLDIPGAFAAAAGPPFLLHSYEVVEDDDGDRVPESGERVRVRISLRNAGQTLDGASAELEPTLPGLIVMEPSFAAGRWRTGEVRTFGTLLEVPADAPRSFQGALRVKVHGGRSDKEIPLPLVLNGPADKRGWPVKGLRIADGLVTAPALGDLDGDGLPEVAAMTTLGDVFVRGADGKLLPGWPLRLRGSHEQSSPLVADLDGDGSAELVLAMNREVHVLDGAGRPLPGWPRPTAGLVLCSPAAGDVNGDGRLEVVVLDDAANLHVFDAGGQSLPGWPRKVGSFSNTTPVLADLDGQPGAEILAGTTDGWIVALRADGTSAPGSWPALVGTMGPSSPAAGDLDGDGDIEIVAVTAAGALYVLDRSGAFGAVARVAGKHSFSSPAIGDLDGDGRAEIAVGCGQGDGTGFVSLFDSAGVMMPGWPVATGAEVSASPALVDLDADGRREVVVPDLYGQLHALRADGQRLPGWPRDLDGWVLSSPVIGDLDGDGIQEIVLGKIVLGFLRTPIAMTYAIETGPAAEPWLLFKGDPRRTGGPSPP
ncbi:MAG TPA: S8 family serine peptidase [Thermoanaerobaculia bacterium]|nr:S8 family serine peptidase [Thermoanaerobaculia bacterium]